MGATYVLHINLFWPFPAFGDDQLLRPTQYPVVMTQYAIFQ